MKSLSPNLMVNDISQTIEYYESNFDFNLVVTVPDTLPYNWAMMTNGDVTLMFQTKDSLAEDISEFATMQTGGSFGLYINVENVNELFEKVKDKVNIIKELFNTFYGATEFIIKDLNGYYITFAQDRA